MARDRNSDFRRRPFIAALSVAAAFALSTGAVFAQEEGVSVKDAWVRAVPPSQKITAAYMVIENYIGAEMTLESASSDIADKTEIHQMSSRDGMMTMQMMKTVTIASRTKVTLKPGGIHLMLIGLKEPIRSGEIIPIRLNFGDGQVVVTEARVQE